MKKVRKRICITLFILILLITKACQAVDVLNEMQLIDTFIQRLTNNSNVSVTNFKSLDFSGISSYEDLRTYMVSNKMSKFGTNAEFDGKWLNKGPTDNIFLLKASLADSEKAAEIKKQLDKKAGDGAYDKFTKALTLITDKNEEDKGEVIIPDENDTQSGWEQLENGKWKYKNKGEYVTGWARIKYGGQLNYYYFGEDNIMYSDQYSPSGFYLKKDGSWDWGESKEDKVTGKDVESSSGTEPPKHMTDINKETEENIKKEKEKPMISGTVILGTGKSSDTHQTTSPTERPDYYDPSNAEQMNTENLVKIASIIVNALNFVGIITAVIVLTILGIKYILGSSAEKAEYKKTMIPYLVGVILLALGTFLIRLVYNLIIGTGINNILKPE